MSIISKENIRNKNLNLLVVFNAIFETQNVSEASRKLRMSQPNVSRALKILRAEFEDVLFVRSSHGISPTPRAIQLSQVIREALGSIKNVYHPTAFEPLKAKGKFTIATTDYMEFLLAPLLAGIVNEEAPLLTLDFRPSEGKLQKSAMEKGECDLTILVIREALPSNYYKQDLFSDPYLCAVRKKHPIVSGKISMERFLAYGHALISPQGTLWSITDEKLEKMHRKRRVVLGTPNAISALVAVSQSDLILTATKRFVSGMASFLPIETFRGPFEIAPLRVAQIWHERSHADPLHSWVRQRIKKLLAS